MDLVYWLLLLKTPQVGTVRFYQALRHFGTPKAVFLATDAQRQDSKIFTKTALIFLNRADKTQVQLDLDWQNMPDCHILTLIDTAYPDTLKQISDPPPVLYIRGDVACLQNQQLAIVGSRNPSTMGSKNAYQFAFDLSKNNLIIISGMAGGVDAQAHIGALEAGGKTIAVCGTGLDRVYPAKHKSLAHQITKCGALISEFPIGTTPIASNFPRRNRIISAMSLGALIVEASIKSGTMITARLANEQGKEVFAIPGSIYNPLSKGCHHLIKEGATLVESANDVLTELNLSATPPIRNKKDDFNDKKPNAETTLLLKCLDYDGLSVDELIEKTQLNAQTLTQVLLELELTNQVAYSQGLGYFLTK
jgi:DNA processing protein